MISSSLNEKLSVSSTFECPVCYQTTQCISARVTLRQPHPRVKNHMQPNAMVHLSAPAATAVYSSTFQVPSSTAFTTSMAYSTAAPAVQMDSTNEEAFDWRELPDDNPCYKYWKSKEDGQRKGLEVPLPPTFFDASNRYAPQHDSESLGRWNKCHLLSLPKELRLEIWKHALVDTSSSDTVTRIVRKPTFLPHLRSREPELLFTRKSRQSPIATALLRVSREIYEEALPILYKHSNFMPLDLEGLFPLFLNTISPSARSCIRNITLRVPEQNPHSFRYDRFKPFFHWAVTCAQVAKLNETLRQVTIIGDFSVFHSASNRRAILYPLLKIKAHKKFSSRPESGLYPAESQIAFQDLLNAAESELRASAALRKERTKADADDRSRRAAEQALQTKKLEDQRAEAVKKYEQAVFVEDMDHAVRDGDARMESSRHGAFCVQDPTPIPAYWIEQELLSVKGLKQFDKELGEHGRNEGRTDDTVWVPDGSGEMAEDWDLVNSESGMSTPRGRSASAASKENDVLWRETASTLVGEEDVGGKESSGDDDASDAEGESWELVEQQTLDVGRVWLRGRRGCPTRVF